MEYVNFVFRKGRQVRLKRKMAEHLEYAGKGTIAVEIPAPEVKASDSVKEEAAALGVDLSIIEGSGKDGRILKRDLQTYRTRMLTAQ